MLKKVLKKVEVHPHTEMFSFHPLRARLPFHLTGFSLSENVDATPSFILTEYDPDLGVLGGCYVGSKSPKEVEKRIRNRPPVRGLEKVEAGFGECRRRFRRRCRRGSKRPCGLRRTNPFCFFLLVRTCSYSF